MIDESRMARLELELRRTKFISTTLAVVVVLMVCVAAARLGQAVVGPFKVLNEDGAEKTVLQANGNVEVGGQLSASGDVTVHAKLEVKQNLVVLGDLVVKEKNVLQEMEKLSKKYTELDARIVTLEKRYKVKFDFIAMGLFKSGNNDEATWKHTFDQNTVGVVGWVQGLQNDKPFVGDNKPETVCMLQHITPEGKLEVQVTFKTHTPVANLGFSCIVVEKP